MQMDVELPGHRLRVFNLRAKHMHLVAAPHHFAHEIDGLGRAAAGRRIKRFVCQKRNAQCFGCHVRR